VKLLCSLTLKCLKVQKGRFCLRFAAYSFAMAHNFLVFREDSTVGHGTVVAWWNSSGIVV